MRLWETFTNQQQWRCYLTKLLKENDKALYRAILIIYELQTQDEKNMKMTTVHNGLGFGSVDANFFSGLALQLKQHIPLSEKQRAIARNKMGKYWKQLMKVAKGEIRIQIVA